MSIRVDTSQTQVGPEFTFSIGEQIDLKQPKARAVEGIFNVKNSDGTAFNFPSESTFHLKIWRIRNEVLEVEFTSEVSPSQLVEDPSGTITWIATNNEMNIQNRLYWYTFFYTKGDGDNIDISYGNFIIF